MNIHGQMLRRLLVVFTLLLSLAAAMPIAGSAQPAANGGPGNSGAAKLCQKDNWRRLAPLGSSVGFANQDECVSYGAEGGEIAQLSGIVVPAGATAAFTGTLSGCNSLAGSWSASDGSSGSFGQFSETFGGTCGTTVPISTTGGPFATGVVLTITLLDRSCNPDLAFDSESNHASWTTTGTSYQVDILDAHTHCVNTGSRIPTNGGGNLSVAIDIN